MPASPSSWLTPLASRIAALSEAAWGRAGIVRMVGASPALADAQTRLDRFARVDPVAGLHRLAMCVGNVYLLGEFLT